MLLPVTVRIEVVQGQGARISWDPYLYQAEPPTTYLVRRSRDDGRTWHAEASLPGAPTAADPVWEQKGDLNAVRSWFLRSGGAARVPGGAIITGGYDSNENETRNTVEFFDASTGLWSYVNPMITKRYEHALVVLADDRVLAIGGDSGTDGVDLEPLCEVYNPTTGEWEATGSMTYGRVRHTATLLADGRVLVTGGYVLVQGAPVPSSTAEVYDPETGEWTVLPAMTTSRYLHTAALLPDGRVLIAGGWTGAGVTTATCELFDPETDTWSDAAPMNAARYLHAAVSLRDGRVLVLGGSTTGIDTLNTAQTYNHITNEWSQAGAMAASRAYVAATVLDSGTVLVVGGLAGPATVGTSEMFDPDTGVFSSAGDMDAPRYFHAQVQLTATQVLIAGGGDDNGDIGTSELFTENGSRSPLLDEHELFVDGDPGDLFEVVARYTGTQTFSSEPAFVVWPEESALTTIWGRVQAPGSESLTTQQRIVTVETLVAGGAEFNTRVFADAHGYWFIRLRSNVRVRITELATSLVRECYVPVDNTKAHHILSLRNVGMREQGWQ